MLFLKLYIHFVTMFILYIYFFNSLFLRQIKINSISKTENVPFLSQLISGCSCFQQWTNLSSVKKYNMFWMIIHYDKAANGHLSTNIICHVYLSDMLKVTPYINKPWIVFLHDDCFLSFQISTRFWWGIKLTELTNWPRKLWSFCGQQSLWSESSKHLLWTLWLQRSEQI